MSHTKGPWEVRRGPGMYFVAGPPDNAVAKIGGTNDLCLANARLIAAAPTLLEALEGLIEGFPLPTTVNEYELVQAGCDPTEARKIANAVAAINAAKGDA